MKNKICIRCGGSNLISDRSLGGKIICTNCGSSNFKVNNFKYTKNKKLIYLIILLVVILIIIL